MLDENGNPVEESDPPIEPPEPEPEIHEGEEPPPDEDVVDADYIEQLPHADTAAIDRIGAQIQTRMNESCIVAQLKEVNFKEKTIELKFDTCDTNAFIPFAANKGGFVAMTVRPATGTKKFIADNSDEITENQLGLPLSTTTDGDMPPKPESMKLVCKGCGIIVEHVDALTKCASCGDLVCSNCYNSAGSDCVNCGPH